MPWVLIKLFGSFGVYLILLTTGADSELTQPPTYLYAKHQSPVEGIKTMACLGLKYPNVNKFTSASECRAIVDHISSFYHTNSRGLLKIKPAGFEVDIPFNGNPGSVYKAEDYAIAKHPGYDMYAIVGMFYGASHAGNHVAHLIGDLYRDAEHETGHLLGLGHAGSYYVENGQWKLDPYGDHDSVMGKFPSPFLTAPQYYHQGWLPEDEVALYKPGFSYQLKRIIDFGTPGLSAVLINAGQMHNSTGRNAYVSFPPKCANCIVLHLAEGTGAGSQKVAEFATEFYDEQFTGLHIKRLAISPGRVGISIDFDKRP